MDVGALSMGLAQNSLKQAVSISVLKMSMDQAAGNTQDFIKLMEQSVQPNLGGTIDIKA